MKERQATQDNNAASMGAGSAINRAQSKSSVNYSNKTWDLVDAVEEDEEALDNLREDEKPEELKGKSKAEMKKYVEVKKKERAVIQKKITDLNAKRTKYVANKKKNNAEETTLDAVMIKAVKEQAKKKNYKFKK